VCQTLNPAGIEKFRTRMNTGFHTLLGCTYSDFCAARWASFLPEGRIPLPDTEQYPEVSMGQSLRMAALAISMVVGLSGFTFAQYYDRDDYYRGGNGAQARQYGYDNGFRDGEKKGRHEGRENDPWDYRTPDWRQAKHGYKSWMGPVNAFQRGYQEGYREGFRSGFASERPGSRGDRGREGFYRGGSYYGSYSGSYGRVAYDTGYQDGMTMAQEDLYKNKPFNPNPRARFDDRDHGYRREYGDKNEYRTEYSNGYRAGYQAGFDRRY
jgi:hypothetical protein